MEEGLLTRSVLEEAKSKTDIGVQNGPQVTMVTALSSMVALFGSLSSGFIVSATITLYNFLIEVTF